MNERKWIDIEPAEPSLSAYEVSKKVINLLRHNQTVQREDDGAVQFWRIKFHLRNQFSQIPHWSDDRWKVCLAAGGRSKRIYQYCSDISGTILYFRALQGHSGRSLIDPLLQDNVIIQRGLFLHIYHIGCAWRGRWGLQGRCTTGRRTREGPEPACVQTPFRWGGTRRRGRMN